MTTTMPAVDRVAASHKAAQLRRERFDMKMRLQKGEYDHREALVDASKDPTSIIGTLRVPDFLKTLPSVGKVKCERILEELEINPRKRLGGLGVRQLKNLWDFLDNWLKTHRIRNRAAEVAARAAAREAEAQGGVAATEAVAVAAVHEQEKEGETL